MRGSTAVTEGRSEEQKGVCQGDGVTEGPGGGGQPKAEPGSHDGRVVQRVADSHKVVTGHDPQEEVVSDDKDNGEIHLCDAALIGDGWTLGLNIHQHFGD